MRRLDSLQAYRGFASILVVLYHVTILSEERSISPFSTNVFSFGFVGVDFFFVLSGFIIFYVHHNDLGHRDKLCAYLTKRFKRIYPLYWIVALVKIVAIASVPSYAKPYERDPGFIVQSLFLLPQPNLPLIGAAWTLTHEVLFYALFGLMIILGRRWLTVTFSLWAVGIIALYAGEQWGMIRGEISYLINFFLNPRNLEFLFGCTSGFILHRYQVKHPSLWLAVGAVLFLSAGLYIDQFNVSSSMMLVLLFGVPSFMIVTGSSTLDKQNRFRTPRLLVFLGDASYSIYLGAFAFVNLFAGLLLHPAVLSLIGSSIATFAMTLFALVGGGFVHLLVESPLREFLKKKSHLP